MHSCPKNASRKVRDRLSRRGPCCRADLDIFVSLAPDLDNGHGAHAAPSHPVYHASYASIAVLQQFSHPPSPDRPTYRSNRLVERRGILGEQGPKISASSEPVALITHASLGTHKHTPSRLSCLLFFTPIAPHRLCPRSNESTDVGHRQRGLFHAGTAAQDGGDCGSGRQGECGHVSPAAAGLQECVCLLEPSSVDRADAR